MSSVTPKPHFVQVSSSLSQLSISEHESMSFGQATSPKKIKLSSSPVNQIKRTLSFDSERSGSSSTKSSQGSTFSNSSSISKKKFYEVASTIHYITALSIIFLVLSVLYAILGYVIQDQQRLSMTSMSSQIFEFKNETSAICSESLKYPAIWLMGSNNEERKSRIFSSSEICFEMLKLAEVPGATLVRDGERQQASVCLGSSAEDVQMSSFCSEALLSCQKATNKSQASGCACHAFESDSRVPLSIREFIGQNPRCAHSADTDKSRSIQLEWNELIQATVSVLFLCSLAFAI